MPQTSVSRSLINALPLPGVDEIVSVAKGLIARMQAAGCERNQCESLIRRIDGLIAAANVCNGLNGFAEVLGELQAVKSRFETALKAKTKFSEILQAQNRLRAYDNLGRELTELMEKAQLQLSASTHKMLMEQFNKRSIEQNFETIRRCDISFDDTKSPTWAPSVHTGSRELIRQPNQVTILYRRGRLGKLRVTYASFIAHSDHAAATEKAEEEVKHLSRINHPNAQQNPPQLQSAPEALEQGQCSGWHTSATSAPEHVLRRTAFAPECPEHSGALGSGRSAWSHPPRSGALLSPGAFCRRVASIVGVTRGYDGLNGLLFHMDGIPAMKFIQISVAGAVLARFVKGFVQIGDFMRQRSILGEVVDINLGMTTVAPNGHVTFLLRREELSDDSDGSEEGEMYPPTELAMDICGDELRYDDDDDEPRSSFPSEPMVKYIESLASLGHSHPTKLQLLKIAAECGFDPKYSISYWSNTAAPLFTLCPGDLGSVDDSAYEGETWEVLEAFNSTSAESYIYDPKDGEHICSWQSLPRTHPEYWTWVSDCHCETARIAIKYSELQERWKDVLKKARIVSEQQEIDLHDISYARAMTFEITAAKRSSSIQPMTDASLYFHRNPLARSTPRDFWGFFSTHSDPCASSTGLEDLGWTLKHQVEYQTLNAKTSWEAKYQRALRKGLAAIPGGYPGADIEELSDDESDDEYD